MLQLPDKKDVKSSYELFKALDNLSANPDFEWLMSFMDRELKRLDKQNRTAQDVKLLRNQGAAQLLEKLLEWAANSQKLKQEYQQLVAKQKEYQ